MLEHKQRKRPQTGDIATKFSRLKYNFKWFVQATVTSDFAPLADDIMDRLATTRPFKNDETTRFVEFVNMIEDSYRNFCRLGLENNISTERWVNIIEKKMSPNLRRHWARIVTCDNSLVDKTNKFPSLLQLIQSEKRAMEYDCTTLRSDPNYLDYKGINHQGVLDVDAQVVDQRDSVLANSVSSCLLHPDSSHRTQDCVLYMLKSVDERFEIVTKQGACWSCLQYGHHLNMCGQKQTCGVKGCRKRHHKSLHVEATRGNTEHARWYTTTPDITSIPQLPSIVIHIDSHTEPIQSNSSHNLNRADLLQSKLTNGHNDISHDFNEHNRTDTPEGESKSTPNNTYTVASVAIFLYKFLLYTMLLMFLYRVTFLGHDCHFVINVNAVLKIRKPVCINRLYYTNDESDKLVLACPWPKSMSDLRATDYRVIRETIAITQRSKRRLLRHIPKSSGKILNYHLSMKVAECFVYRKNRTDVRSTTQ